MVDDTQGYGQAPEMVARESAPTQRVLQMRQQGLSNNQIIQILQRDGYEMDQVFNAMNQADIKQGVDFGYGGDPNQMMSEGAELQNPISVTPAQERQSDQPFYTQPQPGVDYEQGAPEELQQQPSFPPLDQNMGATYPAQPQGQQMQGMGGFEGAPDFGSGMSGQPWTGERERIEELAEAIIDEKWNEIVRSINKIIDWKERMDARISKMEQEVTDLKKTFEGLHQGVLGKINQYDENLSNVGTSLQAMEQVFQKVLPTLTENVNTLSRISRDMTK